MARTIALKVIIFLLSIFLVDTLISSSVAAEIEGQGLFKRNVPVYVSGSENATGYQSVQLEIEYKWRVWNLFGEPVQVAQIRWAFAGGQLPLPTGSNAETFSINSLPSEVLQNVNLFDVKLSVDNGNDFYTTVTRSNANAFFIIDAGAINKAGGNWSFNVAGSPDWSDLLFTQRTSSVPLNLVEDFQALSADEAKEIFEKSLISDQERRVELVDAKIDLSSVWNWWRQKQYKSELFELHKVAAIESAKLIQHYKKIHPAPIIKRIEEATAIKLEGNIDSALNLIKEASQSLEIIWPEETHNLNEIETDNYGALPVELIFETEVSKLSISLQEQIKSLNSVLDVEHFGLGHNQRKRAQLAAKAAPQQTDMSGDYYVFIADNVEIDLDSDYHGKDYSIREKHPYFLLFGLFLRETYKDRDPINTPVGYPNRIYVNSNNQISKDANLSGREIDPTSILKRIYRVEKSRETNKCGFFFDEIEATNFYLESKDGLVLQLVPQNANLTQRCNWQNKSVQFERANSRTIKKWISEWNRFVTNTDGRDKFFDNIFNYGNDDKGKEFLYVRNEEEFGIYKIYYSSDKNIYLVKSK